VTLLGCRGSALRQSTSDESERLAAGMLDVVGLRPSEVSKLRDVPFETLA
jgi:hypothetical protein